MCFFLGNASAFAVTAPAVLSKASQKALAAKGIDCSFSLSISGKSVNGTLKASGKLFMISTPVGTSWYNGSVMATYNPKINETTLVKPTAEELMETNPLLYLNGYSSKFTASFAKTMPKGKHVINLTPKAKRSAVKSVTVTLNAATSVPEKFVVTSSDNTVTTIVIKKLNYAASIPVSTFEYPKTKYPKAEIIDLR